MKWKIGFLFSLCFGLTSAHAQNNLITLENESNSNDGSITITALHLGAGAYTLKLMYNAPGFTSTYLNPYITVVNPGRNTVCKFTPDKSAGYRSFGYRYSYYPGVAFRNTPNNYMHYVLPTMPGKTTNIVSVANLSSFLKKDNAGANHTQGFRYALGDTICAARTGVVYEMNNNLTEGESSNTLYKSDRNSISISHKDGTIAQYSILAPIQSLVKNGEFVIAGQPIAFFNTIAEKYTLLLSVQYLDESKIRKEESKEVYNSLPVYYYLNENAPSTNLVEGQKYECVKSIEINYEELSKREKKKLGL